jgi:hypothetical protein
VLISVSSSYKTIVTVIFIVPSIGSFVALSEGFSGVILSLFIALVKVHTFILI